MELSNKKEGSNQVDLVYILMASYNGERFISKQLDSLLNQSYLNWKLIVRDDGSTDRTSEIIEDYCIRDKRIHVLRDAIGNVRSCQNFGLLLNHVKDEAEYVMFCDQDDIWFPSKIETSLAHIKKLEEENCDGVFCYGTYRLMDSNDHEIQKKCPDYSQKPTLNFLVNQNYVYGCTMIINRGLIKRCLPFPKEAENHDYWITLVASYFNLPTDYIKMPLLFYRQHMSNVSGSYKESGFYYRLKRIASNQDILNVIRRTKLLEQLLTIPGGASKNTLLIKNYIYNVENFSFRKISFFIKNKIRRRTFFQTLAFYLSLIRS